MSDPIDRLLIEFAEVTASAHRTFPPQHARSRRFATSVLEAAFVLTVLGAIAAVVFSATRPSLVGAPSPDASASLVAVVHPSSLEPTDAIVTRTESF